MRHHRARRTRAALVLAAALLLAAGCGNETGRQSSVGSEHSLGQGRWLVGITAIGGSDAEKTETTYVTFDPTTGGTRKVALPAVTAASTDPAMTPLLVSGDRHWAIPDLEITRRQEQSGQVKVYSLADGSPRDLDLQALGGGDLRPIAWAFDPRKPATLHIVDARYRVWSLELADDQGHGAAQGKARQYDELRSHGTVFTNTFDPNTAEPYVESLDGSKTYPEDMDTRLTAPIARDDGTLLPTDSRQLKDLPKSPCELASGFRTSAGESWLICANDTHLRAYVLGKGESTWRPYGRQSPEVGPEVASMTVALPPT